MKRWKVTFYNGAAMVVSAQHKVGAMVSATNWVKRVIKRTGKEHELRIIHVEEYHAV